MSENIIQYVTAARSGDTDAMAKLYSRTLKASYFLADILSAEDESAIDITKKAYARAFCTLDKLKRPEAFEIWMKQNVAAAYKEGKKFVFADAQAGAAENSSEFLTEEVFEDEKKSAMVIKAVSKLKPELRTAVVLHYNNGMPVAALAKFLGVSESTANALLGKAREEIISYAGIESDGTASGAMPVLTKIFQRAAVAASIDNSAVRDIFIYAIDAYEAAKPAMPAAPAQPEVPVAEAEAKEEVEEAVKVEEKEEAPVPVDTDNVISFKQKINEILDKENVPSAQESEAPAEEEKDEDEPDVPGFTASAPSAEAERAIEQFSSYEKKEPAKTPEKKKPAIKLNPKLIGIVCAALVAIVIICVAISKIGGDNPDKPSVENGTTSAISANASGYDWRAGGFAECTEIVYLDENCAYFKSASTEKYGLLDYQGNVILQPQYDGFARCGSGRDYSNRSSYHSLVQIGDEFYEFSIVNGVVTISETPHSPHTVEADSLENTSYDERDRYFEGYAAARKDGKWGYVSQEKDKKVIGFKYDAVNDLQASEAAACDYCRPVTGGYIAVKSGAMMGIIDLEGETVVPFEYSNIMPGKDGVFIAQKGGTWGVILVGDAVTSFTGVNISIDPYVPDNTEDTTSSSSSASRDSYTVVSRNGANVRTDAGAEFEAIGELDYGDTVVAYDTKTASSTGKKWIKIRYNGQYGWVAMSNLEEEGV